MGVVGSRVKTDGAWGDSGNPSEGKRKDQPSSRSTKGSYKFSSLSSFKGACWLPFRKSASFSGISDAGTGTLISEKNSSTEPSGLTTTTCNSRSDGSESSTNVKENVDQSTSPQLKKFSFVELKTATKNFRQDNLLGEGGFGCVYKGWIDEHGNGLAKKQATGITVAVKTLNQMGQQGHKEWLAEVTYLGHLHHPNLVRLIGFCMEDDHRLLVYEYMQRGSLENHLFRKSASPLSWNTRMKIALGAAKGVEFLHSREIAVIYRDFKTSNILLDGGYTAKLSDFGLAKDGPEGSKSHVSTRVMGTYGYAAPEYVMTGHLSSKSDIYSFGVVLLELLTGKRSMDKGRPDGEQNLTSWARPYLNGKGSLFDIMDPRLGRNYPRKEALKAAQLTLACLTRDPKVRPAMNAVVEALEQIQAMQNTK